MRVSWQNDGPNICGGTRRPMQSRLCMNCYGSDTTLTQGLVRVPKRRKIILIESNAKYRYLKKFTCKGTLRHLSETPSPLRFLFGVVKQFCRF
jgi:hypothetical protein